MNRIEINDTEKFAQIIEKYNSIVKDIQIVFQEEDNNFSNVDKNEIWEGNLKNKTFEKYNSLSSKYEEIISSLTKLRDFMAYVLNAYKTMDERFYTELEKYLEQLSINMAGDK